MLSSVAVVVGDGVSPFELGLLCEAWGIDRSDDGVPVLDFAVCAPVPGRIAGAVGFDLFVEHDLSRAADVDLVCVAPIKGDRPVPAEVLELLRSTVDRGARVLSVCSAAFILGEAGLLDGRSCTTHWMYADKLADRFPAARVVPEVLFVDEDPVITSAGTGAGIDASLHLWRKEFGASIAATVARRMVLPPVRDGGQAQFVRRPVPHDDAESLGPLLTWIRENLDAPLDVDTLARRCAMSPRTFARRFRDETGTIVGSEGHYVDVTPIQRSADEHIAAAVAEVATNRAMIEQAKGMLMLIYRVDAERAFEILRWRSGTTNTKLRLLAEQILIDVRALNYGEHLPTRSVYDHVLLTAHTRVARSS